MQQLHGRWFYGTVTKTFTMEPDRSGQTIYRQKLASGDLVEAPVQKVAAAPATDPHFRDGSVAQYVAVGTVGVLRLVPEPAIAGEREVRCLKFTFQPHATGVQGAPSYAYTNAVRIDARGDETPFDRGLSLHGECVLGYTGADVVWRALSGWRLRARCVTDVTNKIPETGWKDVVAPNVRWESSRYWLLVAPPSPCTAPNGAGSKRRSDCADTPPPKRPAPDTPHHSTAPLNNQPKRQILHNIAVDAKPQQLPRAGWSKATMLRTAPIRLTAAERSRQTLVCSALRVSEYTDHVDEIGVYHRAHIMQREFCALRHVLVGLSIVAEGSRATRRLQQSESTRDPRIIDRELLAPCFEVARRFKMMNPDKMRTEYGKLLYVLQDLRTVHGGRAHECILQPKTVGRVLNSHGWMNALFEDELVRTMCESSGERKSSIRAALVTKHAGEGTDTEGNRAAAYQLLDSIDDAHCTVSDAIRPLRRLLALLAEHFCQRKSSNDLSIFVGSGGSKLSHSHSDQFLYVRESLQLWSNILENIFELWQLAECDMFDGNQYMIRNTGQGFHRVKSSPRVRSKLQSLIAQTERELGGRWIGIKVVHLGDNDVPNPLVFIDKYVQVQRIVQPIVQVVDGLDRLATLPGQKAYIERRFGSVAGARLAILRDFFRHGFDGSGDSGGNCIDGRLTSAWNWCSRLDKKNFYHLFLLCGVTGFDGQF
eukprot:TRINITY_DN3710_c1_g1_i5.p1 TRINITY_DN3710_c1_g1~~TRINITY_DN3710_c1_g1_i5.p1  ORF type:complete len:708 (+),score=77.48 TRINITY_DN3710_c1_g1_i5:148-2271(+)